MNNAVSSHKGRALVDQYDISPFITKVTPQPSQEMSDCTTLADDSRSYQPSLKGGTLSMEGLFRSNEIVGASLDDIFGVLPTDALNFTGFPNGRAAGKPAYLMLANTTRYQLDTMAGDLVKCTIAASSKLWALERGVSLHDLVAETGTANGTSVDNLVSTNNGGVAHLHVTAIAGAAPSVTIKIQASANGSTWSDLQTFTVVTAATKQRIEIAAGTLINRFLRVVHTFGGTTTSITFNLSFARRF
jgi:hypothetical protein